MINLVLFGVAFFLIAVWFSKWSTRNHDVFEKKGLKYVKPYPVIGNSMFFFTGEGLIGPLLRTYNMFPKEKLVGRFNFSTPVYIVRDPELVKRITIRDFSHFQDRKNVLNASSDDYFGNVLFAMKGERWRNMRSALSPIFTGSKMRSMMELVQEIARQFVDYLEENHQKNGVKTYKVKDIFSRYTNDVIATTAFGVKIDSLRNPTNEIYEVGQEIMNVNKISTVAKFFFIKFFPTIAKYFGMKILSDRAERVFEDLIVTTMEIRKKEGIIRPDLIELLMKLKEGQALEMNEGSMTPNTKRSWTKYELIAQTLLFFIAGFDTSSGVMAFIAYELATNPDIHERLTAEIDETHENLNGEEITYEVLTKMKYMDMVVSEALRKWPPGIVLERACTQTYHYEDSDGFKFTIDKGSELWVPVYAFHMDPNYFHNPEKFDPERFSDENKSKINMDTYMPFGAGPRNCMGLRFGLMEIKMLFYYLLLNFKLDVCEETQVPLKLQRSLFGLIPEKEIEISILPRK